MMSAGMDKELPDRECFRDEDLRATAILKLRTRSGDVLFPRGAIFQHVIDQVMVRACAVAGINSGSAFSAQALTKR